ncbi:signal peptidase II [Corynebacterium pseudodiphtheriticum]|uniref:signal peptidase II n=1 Tax=Corynebacterium pseudodiphtheriticum TaxID=37637 RepID=UPI002DBCFFED|nr:signal peptidase II [Corynebacterium pseudodiphtheriticum]
MTRLKTLPTRRRAPYLRLMLLVIAGVVGFDQASKIAIEAALQPGQAFPILGDWFRFLLVYNPGAAFSLGSESSTWLFTTFQLFFLVGVLLASPRIGDRFQAIALAMVAGGAGGNLVDRLFREPGFWFGHVVDFISVGDFAIFNVADSFITVGVVLFLAAVFTEEHRARKAVTDTPQNSIEQPARPAKEVDDEH